MTGHDWSDVPERLARLAAAPTAATVFGAGEHGWVVEPPLTEAELTELETQVRVELPEEYRSFLRQVGRGGAGPFYGLFPLRRVDGRWEWEGDGAEITARETLSQPFPYTEPVNPALRLPEHPDEDDFATAEEFTAAEEAWWEQHDAIMYDPAHFIGLVYLSHRGCALRDALVVSGPARGTMWTDRTADEGGFTPMVDTDGTPLGFARWYRRWLDQATEQAAAVPAS
ncbi:SMI1/KNR4 family protein [Micromonospora rosaria]|uniref:SMI1/KNR4 family protein n=1 Tax=Micromonospora rosaria TaxID=47874 RepID=UPI001FE0E183|nr:SMI1/KNR4 family protein [Micromonospora rosaria]